MNQKLIKLVRELYAAEGALVLRSPAMALGYALGMFDLPENAGVLLSALLFVALGPSVEATETFLTPLNLLLFNSEALSCIQTI